MPDENAGVLDTRVGFMMPPDLLSCLPDEDDGAWPLEAQSSRVPALVDLDDINNARTLAVLSVPPYSKVLDVGSGSGAIARALAARGCQVWQIDSDATALRMAEPWCEGTLLGDVETADLDALLGDERADAILLVDVLEHLHDPSAAIRRLVPHLAPSGRIVLSVPHVAQARSSLDDLLRQAGVHAIDEAPSGLDTETRQLVVTALPGRGRSIERLPTLVGTLTDHVHRVEGRCRRLQQRVQDLDRQVQSLRCEHDRLYEALEEAREWHARSAERVATVTEDLRSSDLERQRCEEQLAGTTSELARCQLERRFLREDLVVKDAYLAALRDQIAQREQADQEARALTERVNTLTADHAAAVERADHLAAKLAAETERTDSLTIERAGNLRHAGELASANAELRLHLEGVHQELHRVHVAVARTLAQPRYLIADRSNRWLRRVEFLHAAMKRAWTARNRAQ